MQHYWSLEDVQLQNAWVTIGSFDGVHRGHQEIIRQLTAGARKAGAPAVVLTFHPHPAVVLGKRSDPFYLTGPEARAALLGELGTDYVITHPFTFELANMTAAEFMAMVKERLGLSHLWVGYDFALGRKRQGDVATLRELGKSLGYTLDVMPPIQAGSETISSSQIRAALANGEVERAAGLLGRPYAVPGRVIHGDGRGRTIGVPTANLEVWAEQAIPKAGVYVCQAQLGEEMWGAVTNVGVRPTFENQPASPRVEVHLLDFDRDLYGQEVRLFFLARLRDEQRFPTIDALVAQIHADITRGREILAQG